MIELPKILGSEIIPLRLIPYITNPPLDVPRLLDCLYNHRGDYHPQLRAKTNGNPCVKIKTSDWRNMYDQGGAAFPAGIYVRKVFFEVCCKRKQISIEGEDVALNLSAVITPDNLKYALEGFEIRLSPLTEASKVLAAKRTAPRDEFVETIMERIEQERKQATPDHTMINHQRFMSDAGVPPERKNPVNTEIKKRIATNYNGCYCVLSRPPKKNVVEPYFLPPNKAQDK